MGTVDNTGRFTLGVITNPNGINAFAEAILTVAAGNIINAAFITQPDSTQLSLWNFFFTVVVDNPVLDSNGNFTYGIPYGSGFTFQDPKMNCVVQNWTDWGQSSDTTNRRYTIIRIQNNDTISHNYYIFFKGYSWANRAGIS